MSQLQSQAEQRVLTDAQATADRFLEELGALSGRAGPDDVSIVFFSGHGGLAPTDDPAELDGSDETLVFYDRILRDDEVVSALDSVRGTVVLAIDACNSGGFAEDFMTRPGRLGMFSSDADVLSAVATPRRAGGYLAYHLRRGVLGHSDRSPRDGVLLAGELTDYIYEGFVGDHGLMNPAGARAPLQRLVLQRGSVTHPTMLWIYPRREDLTLPPVPPNPLESQ